jgi:hypothetical protein
MSMQYPDVARNSSMSFIGRCVVERINYLYDQAAQVSRRLH